MAECRATKQSRARKPDADQLREIHAAMIEVAERLAESLQDLSLRRWQLGQLYARLWPNEPALPEPRWSVDRYDE